MTATLPATRRGVVSTATILADLARDARTATARRMQDTQRTPSATLDELPEWMRAGAIAEVASVSQRVASYWLASGKIPSRQAPGDQRAPREARGRDVAAFVRRRTADRARQAIVIPADLPELVSPDQVAEIAHVNTSTVLKWAKDGLIRGEQVGPHRKWRFPAAEVRTVLSLYGDGGFELLAMRRGKGRSR